MRRILCALAFSAIIIGCVTAVTDLPVIQRVSSDNGKTEAFNWRDGADIAYKRALLDSQGIDPDAPCLPEQLNAFKQAHAAEQHFLAAKVSRRYGRLSSDISTVPQRDADLAKVAKRYETFVGTYSVDSKGMLSRPEIIRLSEWFRNELGKGRTLDIITYDTLEAVDRDAGHPADRFEIVSGYLQPKTDSYTFSSAVALAYQSAEMRSLGLDPARMLDIAGFKALGTASAARQAMYRRAFDELYNVPDDAKPADPRVRRAADDFAMAAMQYQLGLKLRFGVTGNTVGRAALDTMAAAFADDLKVGRTRENEMLAILRILRDRPAKPKR